MSLNGKIIINDFIQVAKIAGIILTNNDIVLEHLPAPHSPPKKLPNGKIAVYVFLWKKQCLKVGKVGPRSQARYTGQHYSVNSSESNLAKSIISHRDELGLSELTDKTVSSWIKENMERFNFLIDREKGMLTLKLLETFLQCRLKPKFEGYESQI
jgi:hypothetical protein